MKLKEFFELVLEKRSEMKAGLDRKFGPVPLEMTLSEFNELRGECFEHGWSPWGATGHVGVGSDVAFGPARVLIVEGKGTEVDRSVTVGRFAPDYGSCTTYEASAASCSDLGEAVVRVTSNLVGTLDSVDIRMTESGVWEVKAYTPSGRFITDALASGAASNRAEAEAMYFAGKSWLVGSHKDVFGDEPVGARSKDKGTVVNISGPVIGTVDQETAEKIAEQVKQRGAEQMSAGYDREEPETGIWHEIRERIEDAVEGRNAGDAMQWIELAQQISQAPRGLGFDSDPWVAPEK